MFKRGFPADGMAINNQLTGSIPPPPPQTAPFNGGPFHHQPTGIYSAFTPDYQQFPYTFSSTTPPMYSWANANSTDIMKFTGTSNPKPLDTSTYHSSNFGTVPKRKIDLDAELPQPPKMLITEEKVSASLRDMHISNEYKPHNCCVENKNMVDMDVIENPNLSNAVNILETTKIEPQTTLIMCEELRKLNKIGSIIPQPLLTVQRPNNAVVLWKPQPVIDFVNSYDNYMEPKSTVVITEITDEEESKIDTQDEMFVEDNNGIAAVKDDDEMEL